MAIYHFSLKTVGRSGGRSAVASAAYISGTKLRSEETGQNYNYRKKKEVVFRHIFLPEHAPKEYNNREVLWNAVQKVESRSDARFARMIDVALPREFSRELQIRILYKYIKEQFVSKGMCADVAIHDKGDGNPHAHIMLTTRAFNPDGTWSKKEKSVYKLDRAGNKIPVIDPETGEQKVRVRKGKGTEKVWQRQTIPSNDWNKKENVEAWRKEWATLCNQYLEADRQVDHRSYKRQGLDKEPMIHEGYAARQMEQKGGTSERCDYNREVRKRNQLRQEIHQKVEELYQGIMEKAREIYGRIKRHLGVDEEGRSPVGSSRRRRQIIVAATEGKRDIEDTESFLEGRFKETKETDQFIDQTNRSIDQSEQNLYETELHIAGAESEIDTIKQGIDRQREENERRFRAIMERHQRLMGGDSYDTNHIGETAADDFSGRLPEPDRGVERGHSESEREDQRAGLYDPAPGDGNQMPGGSEYVTEHRKQCFEDASERKGGYEQSENEGDRRAGTENQRTEESIREPIMEKKPAKVRKKPKPKEIGFPRL